MYIMCVLFVQRFDPRVDALQMSIFIILFILEAVNWYTFSLTWTSNDQQCNWPLRQRRLSSKFLRANTQLGKYLHKRF